MKVTVKQTPSKQHVSVVGTQGPAGPSSLLAASDLDSTNLEDGSVIIYNQSISKFETSTVLEKQNLEGGHY